MRYHEKVSVINSKTQIQNPNKGPNSKSIPGFPLFLISVFDLFGTSILKFGFSNSLLFQLGGIFRSF
jgi:hypothetical protein